MLTRFSLRLFSRGKELLERAIALDPEFALPHSILGMYYTFHAATGGMPARQGLTLARASQEAALRIDPSLSEAHGILACCAGMDFNCTGAEEHWVQAMAREPVPRDVLFWRANHYLLPMGRAGEAVVMEARVLEGDPLNLLYRRLYATALLHAHRPADAEIELRKLVEIQEDPFTLETLGIVLATQGRFEDALAVTECAHSSLPESNIIAGQLAAFLIRAVLFHALCGEFGQAATWTERAIDERYAVLVAKIGTLMRPSPQWPALAKLMNLPA